MKLLALDLATQVGFAFFDGDQKVIQSGSFSLGSRLSRSQRMRVLRLWLDAFARHSSSLRIAMEGPAYGGHHLRHSIALASVVELFAEEHKVPLQEVPPSTLKKHATKKGNASKEEMIDTAQEKWPDITIQDDNHADALLIGAWAFKEVEDWGDR